MSYYTARTKFQCQDGKVAEYDIITYDDANKAAGRKYICQEVNRLLSKGMKGEVLIINNDTKEVVSIVSVS